MPRPKKKFSHRECIDCGTELAVYNTQYLWQRRCNFCVKQQESYRKAKGAGIAEKRH